MFRQINRYIGLYYVVIFMIVNLYYMSDSNTRETNLLKKNLDAVQSVPKQSYNEKGRAKLDILDSNTYDLKKINSIVINNTNEIVNKIEKDTNQSFRKGSVFKIQKTNQSFIYTKKLGLKPISWKEERI